jgi:hypothetical protein
MGWAGTRAGDMGGRQGRAEHASAPTPRCVSERPESSTMP